jgi:hypothetical protein
LSSFSTKWKNGTAKIAILPKIHTGQLQIQRY